MMRTLIERGLTRLLLIVRGQGSRETSTDLTRAYGVGLAIETAEPNRGAALAILTAQNNFRRQATDTDLRVLLRTTGWAATEPEALIAGLIDASDTFLQLLAANSDYSIEEVLGEYGHAAAKAER